MCELERTGRYDDIQYSLEVKWITRSREKERDLLSVPTIELVVERSREKYSNQVAGEENDGNNCGGQF